jgi:hypothetical protein
MVKKGRQNLVVSLGELNGSARLTEREVAKIKWLLINDQSTNKEIQEQYDISSPTVCHIKRGRTWGWVQPVEPATVPTPRVIGFLRRF